MPLETRRRDDVDDVSASPLLQKHLDGFLASEPCSSDIDVEARIEVFDPELVRKLTCAIDASVVHHHVNATKLPDGFFDKMGNLVLLGDIARDVLSLTASLVNCSHRRQLRIAFKAALIRRLVDVADHHACSFSGICHRDATSKTGTSASDDTDLTFESVHKSS